MAFKFYNYIDHLDSINYAKYSIIVGYYDLRFRYANVNPSSTHKFTFQVYGTVNLYDSNLEPKDYLIYSEERTDNVDEWVVRIPELNPKNAWDKPPALIDNCISPAQNVYQGLGYGEPAAAGTGVGVFVCRPDQIAVVRRPGTISDLTFTGGEYVPVNINDKIKEYVLQYYGRYNDYPGLTIEGNGENNSQYYFIPLGVINYKVVLKSETGERIETVIPGTMQGKAYLQAGAAPTYNPSAGLTPGNVIVTLDARNPNGSTTTTTASGSQATVPNVIGYTKTAAEAIIVANGFTVAVDWNSDFPDAVYGQQPGGGEAGVAGGVVSITNYEQVVTNTGDG